jgi:hypothetical protein
MGQRQENGHCPDRIRTVGNYGLCKENACTTCNHAKITQSTFDPSKSTVYIGGPNFKGAQLDYTDYT